MVIGEGMNKAAHDLLDLRCASAVALRGALGTCLAGTNNRRSGMTLQGIAWEPLQLLRRRA